MQWEDSRWKPSHIPCSSLSLLHCFCIPKRRKLWRREVSYLCGSLLKSVARLHCASLNQLLTCYETDVWLAGVCIKVPVRKEKKIVKERRMKTWTVNFLPPTWGFQSMTWTLPFSQLDILWYCSPFPILDETTFSERIEAAGFWGNKTFFYSDLSFSAKKKKGITTVGCPGRA